MKYFGFKWALGMMVVISGLFIWGGAGDYYVDGTMLDISKNQIILILSSSFLFGGIAGGLWKPSSSIEKLEEGK